MASFDQFVMVAQLPGKPWSVQSGTVAMLKINKGGKWDHLQRLEPDANARRSYDRFGYAVAISAGLAVVGAPLDSTKIHAGGAAYLFRHLPHKSTWGYETKLLPQVASEGESLGMSVAAHYDTVALGAPGCQVIGPSSGCVYVFRYNQPARMWFQTQQLVAHDPPQPGQRFGFSVAMGGDTLAVGAPLDSATGKRSGAVYLFTWDEEKSEFGLPSKVLAADGEPNMHFGSALAVCAGYCASVCTE